MTQTEGWGSVRDGKWHRTVSDQPTFTRDEESLCGLTFRPLNVVWGDKAELLGQTTQHHICKHCDH